VFRVCPGWTALCVGLMALVVGGCSSSSPPISVSLSPSFPQAIDQGQTAKITATVTNDGSFKGVSWSLTGPGSLSNSTGQSVTYISPTTNLTSSQQATVNATSVADQTKSASVRLSWARRTSPERSVTGIAAGLGRKQAPALHRMRGVICAPGPFLSGLA
jgi:hypothetical protein